MHMRDHDKLSGRKRVRPALFQRPWGIRTRFVAALVTFAVVLSASIALLTAHRMADTLDALTKDRGRIMLKQLARDVLAADALTDPLERETRLLVLANRVMLDEALYVQVVLDGEQVVASAEEGWLPSLELEPADDSSVREKEKEGERYYDFFTSLPSGESGPSYVRFGLSLAPMQEQIRNIVHTTMWIALLFSLAGLIVATWLYRRVFGPLNRLLDSVRRLAGGDGSARADIATGDELEELAGEFNRMADAIASRTAQLERANVRLARADQVKSDFLATMSHEWKTPLHALRGYAQLLLEEVDGPLTEAQREDVEAMLASANHLLDLIENILHFIKSEHDEAPNHVETFDLVALARQAWDHVRPAARTRHIVFHDEMPDALYIQGDRTRLRQVFINLIGNAVQYTTAGSITLRGGRNGDGKVWLSVIDTGIGIPADQLETIFEPFERVRNHGASSARNGSADKPAGRMEGIGLGLTVAKRYVDLHGGEISVTSVLGKGSTFTVTLPGLVDITGEPSKEAS